MRCAETRRMLTRILDAGGTVRRTKRGHYIVRGPGGTATVCSKYAGRGDNIARNLATIRRHAGLAV